MLAITLILMLLLLLVAFDLAAWRWGVDSRDQVPRGADDR